MLDDAEAFGDVDEECWNQQENPWDQPPDDVCNQPPEDEAHEEQPPEDQTPKDMPKPPVFASDIALSTAQYVTARAIHFAMALDHPSLDQLLIWAENNHPEMMLDKNMLLSEKQQKGIELQRQRRSPEEQSAIVAKMLREAGIIDEEATLAPSQQPCPDPPAQVHEEVPFEVRVHTWPFLRHLGNTAVRCAPYSEQSGSGTAGSFTAFTHMIESVAKPDHRQEFLFLHYAGVPDAPLRQLYGALSSALERKSPTLVVGRPPASQDVWVLCRFGNYSRCKQADFDLLGIAPWYYRAQLSGMNPVHKPARMLEVFEAFIASLGICGGDLALVAAEVEWTADALEAAVAPLTAAQLERLHMDARLIDAEKRTTFQQALLKAYQGLQRLRTIQAEGADRPSAIRIGGPQDPGMLISDLINLDQPVRRLNEITGEVDSFSLQEYVANPKYFLAYGLLIIGADDTTGFGKSLAAIVIALHWLQRFVTAGLVSKEKACVVQHNTIDGMRDSQEHMCSYVPVVLDEFMPADVEQNQYCSADMLKGLMNINKPRDIRARQRQVRLHSNQPIILTANGNSEAEWVGARFKWSAPLARKICVLQVTKPLLTDETRRRGSANEASCTLLG